MNVATLTVFDWSLVALLAYSVVRAFLRGFILEIFSIVGLVAGVLLASWNYNTLATTLSRWISPLTTAQIVAFLVISIGIMVAAGLLGKILRSGADAIGLGFIDRVLGAVFGLARGCLLAVAVMLMLTVFMPQSSWIQNSQLAPYFLAGAHGVSFVVPHDLQQQISNGALQLKHNAPDWIKRPQ